MSGEPHEIRVGVALGGGIARGLAHLGVLQVLAETGIRVDVVAGVSVGSLVGALFAAGMDAWEMEQVAHRMKWQNLVRLQLRRDGLLDTQGLARFILDNIGDVHFDHLRLPFAAVAGDLLLGEMVVLKAGRVADAVRASCAIPGVFAPVRLDGRLLVDGGLVNSVPSTVCRDLGADYVIAVDLNRSREEPQPPRNLVHVILYSLAIMQRPQVQGCLADADVVIQPDLTRFGYIELDRVREMVAIGREAAEAALPRIQAGMAEWVATRQGAAGAGQLPPLTAAEIGPAAALEAASPGGASGENRRAFAAVIAQCHR